MGSITTIFGSVNMLLALGCAKLQLKLLLTSTERFGGKLDGSEDISNEYETPCCAQGIPMVFREHNEKQEG